METIQRTSSISFPMLGNWSINPPSYFTVFGKNIYFYGVIIALAFLLGIFYVTKNAKKVGLTEDDAYDALLWMIPCSIIGARLYFVLFKLDYYLANPREIIAVWEGGLAIYGGIIAGALAIFFVCRHKKVKPLAMLDLFIVACCIGQAIGRWGNFINREAFGAETDIFCRMGLTNPAGVTIYVHPTFLYESLWNVVGFLVLNRMLQKGRRFDGQCLYSYFIWYGLGRFWIEGLRTDSLYIGSTDLRISQLLSLVLVAAGTVLMIINGKNRKVETDASDPQR